MAESATSVGSLTFLGLFAMFSLSPRSTFYASRQSLARMSPREVPTGVMPCAGCLRAAISRLVRYHPQTSYWQGGAKEMAAINTILIIVNRTRREGLTSPQNSHAHRLIEATLRLKQGELAAGTQNVPLTISVIGCRQLR